MKPELNFYKELKLITPEFANEMGLFTEAPVFISPIISQEKVCGGCGVTYRPLVYGVGITTQAHHFHITPLQHNVGGIYYFLHNGKTLPDRSVCSPFWAAIIEPQGEKTSYLNFGNSEQVLTRGIMAFEYYGHDPKTGIKRVRWLRRGILSQHPGTYSLLPQSPNWRSALRMRELEKFAFQIDEEGQIYFSLLRPPETSKFYLS